MIRLFTVSMSETDCTGQVTTCSLEGASLAGPE